MADAKRSRAARAASERALVRVVHHYGARPEFVVLGGLVPELLCAASGWRHAGTTDVDVQVDLEVACGAVNTARLENALRNAEFEPDTDRVWRWVADGTDVKTVVKFELLADLDTEPNQATVRFDACDNLGAVNLRGTGFASRDPVIQQLTAKIGGDLLTVEVNVSVLPGSSSPSRQRRAAAGSPRTGTTSRSCCCTTMSAAPHPRRTLFEPGSSPSSSERSARRSTTSWPTSRTQVIRAPLRMPSRC